MDNRRALDPQHSVIVEACAGSGKTWLLVSRIVRLLLDGVEPGEILAITFTRKAAQEMQARLHDWLYELASTDDSHVCEFLRQRAVAEKDIEEMLPRARSLYQQFLLAQPAITISTFHGWFMQILQRAPLNAGMAGNIQLAEQTSALRQEAWQTLLDRLHADGTLPEAQSMLVLFGELGLSNTKQLLFSFLAKRSEWWAYAQGQKDAVAWALDQLRDEFGVDIDADPVADACADASLQTAVYAFAKTLATGTETQCGQAGKLQAAWELADPNQHYAALSLALYTQADEPRSFNPTKKQDIESFLLARDVLFDKMQAVRDRLSRLEALKMNQHALRCGAALLDTYQELKQRQQMLDFGDLEWRVCRLLNDSDHAEYLQYKLDSRYRHVLLDEFQDTNPLQWQILQSWFAASASVQSTPAVFVVGDPKQSIYRFRRADARLFGVVRKFLERHYGAHHLTQNVTRRNSPPVLAMVNSLFGSLPEFPGFETHHAHQQDLPGHVEILPLCELPEAGEATEIDTQLKLRNPLIETRQEHTEHARELEAQQFAEKILQIAGHWKIRDEAPSERKERPAQFSDIMVLVRRRTHLRAYEHALRKLHIPYLTSRRGGLLDTLEATDIQALLTFLITPFADLQLAHILRTPIFCCSDDDLMLLSESGKWEVGSGEWEGNMAATSISNPKSWWLRLRQVAASGTASPHLQRAFHLLENWLQLADKLPVHDLLDRIYFGGDIQNRYAMAVPDAMRPAVLANLQAFIEIALNIDAGRYPSLPGFLRELAELQRAGDDEAPDEGKISHAGNALRIYTVHEAKGLEAPIVWLLDTNTLQRKENGYDVLLDWPTGESRPTHFSLYGDKASRGTAREAYFEQDAQLACREDLNLLYVAMTRAKQVLMVSGNSKLVEGSWYQRLQSTESNMQKTDSCVLPCDMSYQTTTHPSTPDPRPSIDERLNRPLPTGYRKTTMTDAQRHGTWLHALMQHIAPPNAVSDIQVLQQLGIPAAVMPALWQQAQHLISMPHLSRFFDQRQYQSAGNEVPYINARGELRRIDRLVEFDDEVWVLDYKTAADTDPSSHTAQMGEYRASMQAIYPHKTVRCALILGNGELLES